MCRAEAATLSALAEEMRANGYSLYAVLHEELGWEEFETQVFSPHPVYLDVEKRFYGPELRRESALKIFSPSTLFRAMSTSKAGGNMKGDGLLMGSVFAISPTEVIFEHREKTFGDAADPTALMEAVKQHKLN